MLIGMCLQPSLSAVIYPSFDEYIPTYYKYQPNYDIKIEVILPIKFGSQHTHLKNLDSHFYTNQQLHNLDDVYSKVLELSSRLHHSKVVNGAWHSFSGNDTYYILSNKILKIRYGYYGHIGPILESIERRDSVLYDKYFNQPKLKYTFPFHFIRELNASIVCCKIGKQEGWDYTIYKDRAQILLFYLKDVYKYLSKDYLDESRGIKQIITLFEKDLSQL